jgi:hypothetical protein
MGLLAGGSKPEVELSDDDLADVVYLVRHGRVSWSDAAGMGAALRKRTVSAVGALIEKEAVLASVTPDEQGWRALAFEVLEQEEDGRPTRQLQSQLGQWCSDREVERSRKAIILTQQIRELSTGPADALRWIAQQPCTEAPEDAADDTPCAEDGRCVTEYCYPCYARAEVDSWLQRKRDADEALVTQPDVPKCPYTGQGCEQGCVTWCGKTGTLLPTSDGGDGGAGSQVGPQPGGI